MSTPNAKRRWAVDLATAVIAYVVIADCLLRPLHGWGYLQPILAYADGLSAILQAPGIAVIILAGFRHGHHTTWTMWWCMLPINFVLWTVAFRVFLAMIFPSAVPRPQRDAKPSETPNRVSRRAILTGGARIAAVGIGSVGAYSFLFEPRHFQIVRQTRAIRGLPPQLDGLRLVQLTDIHHGPNLSLRYVRRVIAAANALRPDITLLTGDYVYRSPQYIAPVVQEFAALRANIGIVGVLGNHDWWEDADLTRRQFARVGLPLIDNDRVIVTPDRKLLRGRDIDSGLCIAGVGDYTEDVSDFHAALGGVAPTIPRLVLSHNPDAAEDANLIAARHRIDLMICGHTHGGQAWIPGLGRPVVPSRYGQKYAYGSVRGPVCDVYVCAGIGTSILPMRFEVPPEINVIDLLRCA
jgi:predicted MPP superfamily phosphohydrolase